MIRRFFLRVPLLRAVLVFAALSQLACAQSFDASSLREPHDLDSKWLIHAGDDPAFARPEFDDSRWIPFDPYTQITALLGKSRPEVVWYRLRVKVNPTDTGLALREWNISRAFEIYVNGERLISSGQVVPFLPYTAVARLLERIPDRLTATGSLLIAIRVRTSANEWEYNPNPGYYATNLTLGQYNTLLRDKWLLLIGENAVGWLDRLLLIGLGFIALVFYIAERRQPEYLWIFALGALALSEAPLPVCSTFFNVPAFWVILGDLPRLASPFIWVSLYFAFVHQRIGWRWRVFLALAGLLNALSGLQGTVFSAPLILQFIFNLPFIVLLSVVVPLVLAFHLRRGNREAGILLIPATLFSLYIYAEVALDILFQIPAWSSFALAGLNLIDRFPAGPFALSLNNVSNILSTCSLAVIMLLRSTTSIRRQTILEGELAAAQQVQQVLLPEHIESVPGFTVETIYQPAQQVGGDFFQVLPAANGGLLVVVGDVAGKGLPAAMLVSVLVGSIRSVAEYTQNPAEVLASLNERLYGRSGADFATALVGLISADGSVEIANAGHLSPYMDGTEVELTGALPLGIKSPGGYETIRFQLPAGSRLTFYSDGVVEARNAGGELFGFERSRQISNEPASAIVEAARQFGQQDDITVVSITRAAAIATAA